jgi:hypothetical protein
VSSRQHHRTTGAPQRGGFQLQEEYDTLDRCENGAKNDGNLIVGREDWQLDGNYAHIGVEYLCLEHLWDDNSEHPFVGIWTGKPKKPAMDVKGIKRLFVEAKKLMAKEDLAQYAVQFASDGDIKASDCDYQYQLWYHLPEERKEIRRMLVEDDGQEFVDCMVGHFKILARFIPVLDGVFAKPTKK